MRFRRNHNAHCPSYEPLELRTLLSVTPNDTYFSQQWGLNNSNNVDIDAPEAWGITTGSSPAVVVAELEGTGVDVAHPDFSGKIVSPWNFDNGTPTFAPTTGHGTNITGIIGAVANNNQGIAGVDWGAQVMPLQASFRTEYADAVNYAVAHGAKVISMSIAYPEAQAALSADPLCLAIEAAASQGVVVVAAAGNGGTSNSTNNPGQDLGSLAPTVAPAAFRTVPGVTNMITVGAVDSSGNLASFSNYGTTSVDVGAPGVNIETTELGGGYISFAGGTSFAAPFVAGVVALVASQHPEYTAQQLVQAVTQHTKPLASLNGKTITGGMVDAYNALLAGLPNPTASATPGTVTGTTTNLSVNGSYGGGEPGLTYTWSLTSMPGGAATPTFSVNGTNSAKNTTATFYAAGNYTFQAVVSNGDGYMFTTSVPVSVSQTSSTIIVSPATATVVDGSNQGLSASVKDQFGAAVSAPGLTWSVNSGGVGGTINQSGTYTAPTSGTGTDTVKVTSGSAAATATMTVTAPAQGSISIDCGSTSNVSPYVADTSYLTSTRGGPYSTTDGVDTSAVPAPAPLAVYQTGEYGDFTYTIPNLTPGGAYIVRLHFVEFAHGAVGQRVFNVLINGTTVLNHYDIFAQAGATHKAVVQVLDTTADSTGTLRIQFQTVVDGAYCSAIEVDPAETLAIDCGSSSAVSPYVADTPYVTSTRGGPYSTTDGVDTSAVPDPAPLAVYQTGEYGDFTYTIPGLFPGATYTVRFSFVEFAHGAVGQRIFNVLINGTTVLNQYDIYAQAGATHKAVYQMVSGTADSTGTLKIQFQTVVDGAYCSAIEVMPASSLAIDCGSSAAVGPFVADTPYLTSTRGGPYSTTDGVDTSAVPDPVPLAVYRTGEYGDFSYTISGLVPGATFAVQLSFVEFAHGAVGQRIFNVLINGTTVLNQYDIYAQAGATHKAVYQMVSGTADSTGTLKIQFQTVVDGAFCSAIQIYPVVPAQSGGGPQVVIAGSPKSGSGLGNGAVPEGPLAVKKSPKRSASDAAGSSAGSLPSTRSSVAILALLSQALDGSTAGGPWAESGASAGAPTVLSGPVLTPSDLGQGFDELLTERRKIPFGWKSRLSAE